MLNAGININHVYNNDLHKFAELCVGLAPTHGWNAYLEAIETYVSCHFRDAPLNDNVHEKIRNVVKNLVKVYHKCGGESKEFTLGFGTDHNIRYVSNEYLQELKKAKEGHLYIVEKGVGPKLLTGFVIRDWTSYSIKGFINDASDVLKNELLDSFTDGSFIPMQVYSDSIVSIDHFMFTDIKVSLEDGEVYFELTKAN